MIPRYESKNRILCLQKKLKERGIDGALFVYPIDVYYFCGSRQNACLWVPVDGNPSLFVRKSLLRAKEESIIEDVRPFPYGSEFLSSLVASPKKIGMTFDVMPVQHYQYYSNIFPAVDIVDISDINRKLRSVKSEWELQQLSESGRRLCEMFSSVPSFLKLGMKERDLAAEIEFRLRSKLSEGNLRMRAFNQEITGLAVTGKSAAAPGCFDGPVSGAGLSSSSPFGPSNNLTEKDIPILIDYPGIFSGYIVDMTRIFVFGDLDHEMKMAFDVSLEIQAWLVNNTRPGTICEDLYAGAVRIAESAGIGDKFMGYDGEQSKFVGHGVGLELDELPVLARRFKYAIEVGQAIAIEPKFIFPGKGVVGIENTFVVTATGCEKLTDFPDHIVYL